MQIGGGDVDAGLRILPLLRQNPRLQVALRETVKLENLGPLGEYLRGNPGRVARMVSVAPKPLDGSPPKQLTGEQLAVKVLTVLRENPGSHVVVDELRTNSAGAVSRAAEMLKHHPEAKGRWSVYSVRTHFATSRAFTRLHPHLYSNLRAAGARVNVELYPNIRHADDPKVLKAFFEKFKGEIAFLDKKGLSPTVTLSADSMHLGQQGPLAAARVKRIYAAAAAAYPQLARRGLIGIVGRPESDHGGVVSAFVSANNRARVRLDGGPVHLPALPSKPGLSVRRTPGGQYVVHQQ